MSPNRFINEWSFRYAYVDVIDQTCFERARCHLCLDKTFRGGKRINLDELYVLTGVNESTLADFVSTGEHLHYHIERTEWISCGPVDCICSHIH
jgi:hypothetical protein